MAAFVIQSQEESPTTETGPAHADIRPEGLTRVIGPFYDVDSAECWCEDSLSSGRLAGTREFIIEAREIGYAITAKLESE